MSFINLPWEKTDSVWGAIPVAGNQPDTQGSPAPGFWNRLGDGAGSVMDTGLTWLERVAAIDKQRKDVAVPDISEASAAAVVPTQGAPVAAGFALTSQQMLIGGGLLAAAVYLAGR